MKKLLLILIFIAVFLTACIKSPTSSAVQQQFEGPFLVVKVIDGDTLILNTSEHVRLSGIDTPEAGECYYQDAKARLATLVEQQDVYLEQDITNKDKYKRLLRYIYINDVLVNSILVEEGAAKVFDAYKDDTRRYLQLKRLEDVAKTSQRGLWSCPPRNCLYVGSKNSDKYYPPECRTARRIKPENQLCFTSEEEVRNRTRGKC